MNTRQMKKARSLSVNSDRLNDSIEQYPAKWLLKKKEFGNYTSMLESLKGTVLCMDERHENYQLLPDEDKEKAIKLAEHPEIVDMVLLTTFQWFGTNVGKHTIGELMDKIRKLERE